MKKVLIKCTVRNTIDSYKYQIKIIDKNKHIIAQQIIENYIYINLKYGLYKIILKPQSPIYPRYICQTILKPQSPIYPRYICQTIIVNNKIENKYIYIFNLKPKKIIIKLLENENIKIEKGEIKLWPKIL